LCKHRRVPILSFYKYKEDGTNRLENITDWAHKIFVDHYKDNSIGKWDIFYYVYALLHHPLYREKYQANLKSGFPYITLAPDFSAFVQAGQRLVNLHVHYEQQPEFPLEMIEDKEKQLDWQVEAMKLSKDKSAIVYNDFLTLGNIPVEAFEYRLGKYAALQWIIKQYQVKKNEQNEIISNPNQPDDPQYIVRLIGQVVYVSLETVKITNALPDLGIEEVDAATV